TQSFPVLGQRTKDCRARGTPCQRQLSQVEPADGGACADGGQPDRRPTREPPRGAGDAGESFETTHHVPPPQNRSGCGLAQGTASLSHLSMANEVELASLDLRYQSFRLKQSALEERLLASIAQRGIEEPLEGVEVRQVNVLLNGLKRHRCARKLRLATVPYSSLGQDEAVGILSLLRTSNNRALSILEQAAFI